MPKLRIKYTRDGLLSYLSHLDMVRLWQRAFVRANIPIEMSQGHSPRPKLSFGPPLAVGYTSAAEYLDATVKDAVSTRDVVARLNEVLPEDIRVVHARRMMPREAAVSASINAITYQVKVPAELIGGAGEGGCACELVDEFRATDELVIERVRKGRIQRIDLRVAVRDIAVDFHANLATVTIVIELGRGPYPKPEEVLRAVFRLGAPSLSEVDIHRADVGFRTGGRHPRPTEV